MTYEQIVRARHPDAILASQRKRNGMMYQVAKRLIVTTKLQPLGGWCKSEAGAWKSAAGRIAKQLAAKGGEGLKPLREILLRGNQK